MVLATVSEALCLISRLNSEIRHIFGVNPETAHSRIVGLDFLWDIEMALEAGKLIHLHPNSQGGQCYDEGLPFGYTEPLLTLGARPRSGPRRIFTTPRRKPWHSH